MNYKLDTDDSVFFYEQEFYCLSNFSSFRLLWAAYDFDTVEHAYHWSKFPLHVEESSIHRAIRTARSAHDAFKIARTYTDYVSSDWLARRTEVMKQLLKAKVRQHPYVKKKLLETGDRMLVEDSWRDDFWGWGPDKVGENRLGQLWMEVREEVKLCSTH
jgi:ribA/ribD-fused uncharacterized protein